MEDIAAKVHQVALDPHLTIEDLNEVCEASNHFKFGGICTNLSRLKTARAKLGSKSQTKLISVIGFPFGFIPTEHKKKEADWAADHGADELDLVPDFFSLAEGNINFFAEEIAFICETGLPVTVIVDISRLSRPKLAIAIEAAVDAGASGIQSGNGFGSPAKSSEISQIFDFAKGRCGIKAAGGIKSKDKVLELINAGATKIGTSFGPQIMNEFLRELK